MDEYLKILFKVAKYKQEDGKFIHNGYEEYNISFCKTNNSNVLSVVVNGFNTRYKIDLNNMHVGYKSQILKAIRLHKEVNPKNFKSPRNLAKLEDYSNIKNFLRIHLLAINKEEKRDVISKYNLINYN